jgi:hypothetical protein
MICVSLSSSGFAISKSSKGHAVAATPFGDRFAGASLCTIVSDLQDRIDRPFMAVVDHCRQSQAGEGWGKRLGSTPGLRPGISHAQ